MRLPRALAATLAAPRRGRFRAMRAHVVACEGRVQPRRPAPSQRLRRPMARYPRLRWRCYSRET